MLNAFLTWLMSPPVGYYVMASPFVFVLAVLIGLRLGDRKYEQDLRRQLKAAASRAEERTA